VRELTAHQIEDEQPKSKSLTLRTRAGDAVGGLTYTLVFKSEKVKREWVEALISSKALCVRVPCVCLFSLSLSLSLSLSRSFSISLSAIYTSMSCSDMHLLARRF
jgi:hypothetical protein